MDNLPAPPYNCFWINSFPEFYSIVCDPFGTDCYMETFGVLQEICSLLDCNVLSEVLRGLVNC